MNKFLSHEKADNILKAFFKNGYNSCGEKHIGWVNMCGEEDNVIMVDFEAYEETIFYVWVLHINHNLNMFEIQGVIEGLVKELDDKLKIEEHVKKEDMYADKIRLSFTCPDKFML